MDLDVMVDVTGGGQDAAEVCEMWYDGELLAINGEDRHFWLVGGVLHNDLGFCNIDL